MKSEAEFEFLRQAETRLENIANDFGALCAEFNLISWNPRKPQKTQELRQSIHALFSDVEDDISELIQKIADLQEALKNDKNLP